MSSLYEYRYQEVAANKISKRLFIVNPSPRLLDKASWSTGSADIYGMKCLCFSIFVSIRIGVHLFQSTVISFYSLLIEHVSEN